jgi:hypothetical protein
MKRLMVCLAAVLASGCDEMAKGFDREKARELIEATPVVEGFRINIGKPRFDCLRETGHIASNMIFTSLVTPKGAGLVRKWSQDRYFPNASYMIFATPVNFKDVRINGLLPVGEGDNEFQIEFTGFYEFPDVEDSEALSCLSSMPTNGDVKARARLYDDGWRVEYVKEPTALM